MFLGGRTVSRGKASVLQMITEHVAHDLAFSDYYFEAEDYSGESEHSVVHVNNGVRVMNFIDCEFRAGPNVQHAIRNLGPDCEDIRIHDSSFSVQTSGGGIASVNIGERRKNICIESVNCHGLVVSDGWNPMLTDNLGLVTVMHSKVMLWVRGDGSGQYGESQITLKPGLNQVSPPLKDKNINVISDLLSQDGIKNDATEIIVSDEGTFKLVVRPGDGGDFPLERC